MAERMLAEQASPSFAPSRRDLLVGGLTLAAAGTAFARMPRRALMGIGPGQLDKIVPTRIGDWQYESASGLVLPPPDQMARLLYDQQLMRSYASPDGLTVMVLMAYGSSQSGMLQIHRPEICYPASGFHLSETRHTDIPFGTGRHIPARSFVARGDTRVEQVLYWSRIGDMLPTSWAGQRLAIVRSNLAGYVPDGLLVRLSTLTDDEMQAQATLKTFARRMLEEMPLAARRMLVGAATGSR